MSVEEIVLKQLLTSFANWLARQDEEVLSEHSYAALVDLFWELEVASQ